MVMATMFPMVTIALLAFIVHSSNSSLTDIDNCRQGSFEPKVTVANSTHLNVSWEGVFLGCSGKKVELILDEQVTRIEEEQAFTAIPADVCLKHTVTMGVENEDSKHVLVYNENTRLYGGLLENMRRTICTKRKKDNCTVVSLDIPEKIRRCILSRSEAKVEERKWWEPNFVQLEIINPEVADKSLTIDVDLLKSQPDDCESPKNGNCKPSSILPQVQAVNSTHSWISWNNTFTQECNKETIESVTLILDSQNVTKDLDFEEIMNISLAFNPCVNQTLSVTMNLKNGSKHRVFRDQVNTPDSVLCDLQPIDLVLAFLVALATTLVVVLTVGIAILFLRRNKTCSFCRLPLDFTPIKVYHLPDATYLPTPWSHTETETETQSSSESQQSSMYRPPSSRNGLLTTSPAAKVETELLVDLNGSTIKKTRIKRPKTDGVKSVDVRYKWQLTNMTSDGEEEEVTIVEGGGRSNQASPDPRRNPGRFPPEDKPDFSSGGLQTDQMSSARTDSNEITVVGRLVIETEEEGARSNKASPDPRRYPGRFARRDGPDIQQDRSQSDLLEGGRSKNTDKILVVHTNPEQTHSSIYLK